MYFPKGFSSRSGLRGKVFTKLSMSQQKVLNLSSILFTVAFDGYNKTIRKRNN